MNQARHELAPHRFLILIPHPDDEVFCIPWIQSNSKNTAKFLYLTRAFREELSTQRLAESKFFLEQTLHQWKWSQVLLKSCPLDGDLAEKIVPVTQELCELLRADLAELSESKITILSPDWEGGHPDHDAAYLIARLLQKKYQTAEHWTYSAYRKSEPLPFRVQTPLLSEQRSVQIEVLQKISIPYGVVAFFNLLRSTWRSYLSQKKTWLILSPVWILDWILGGRKFRYLQVSLETLARPHSGILWYEVRKMRRYEDGFPGWDSIG